MKRELIAVGRVLVAALIIGGLTVGPGRVVHAQKAVLAPVSGDAESDAARKLSAQALKDALEMQGFTVTSFEQASQRLSTGESCDEACPARLLRAVSADLSASAMLVAADHGAPSAIRVTLLDKANHPYEGSANVRDGDIRDATTRALLEARSYQLLGPGPWLRIDGTPEGAEVLLDDRIVGALPYRATIEPGKHSVVVRDAGYGRFMRTIQVPDQDSKKLTLQVALEPVPLALPTEALELEPADAPVEVDHPSHAWLAAPISLAALGVGLASVVSVRLAAGLDGCVDPDAWGRCTERGTVRVWSTAGAYALSAALIGTGVIWIVLGSSDDSPSLAASVGVDHLSLAGSF